MTQALWHLYLAFLVWMVVPFIGASTALFFPLSIGELHQIWWAALLVVIPIGLWSGARGGPLMLSETDVLYGLAGRQHRIVGLGAIARQAATVGGLAGLSASFLWSIAQTEFHLGRYVVTGLSGLLWGTSVVMLAVATSPAISWGRTHLLPTPERTWSWKRAGALTDVQVASNMLDMRGALVSLRRVRDGDRRPRVPYPSVARFGSFARSIVSMASLPSAALVRWIGVTIGLAAVLLASTGQARVVLAAVVLFVVAIDVTVSLAAAVDSQLLVRPLGYRAKLLAAESIVSLIAALGTTVVAWLPSLVGNDPMSLWSAMTLMVGATLAGCIQARLGAPNPSGLMAWLPPDQAGAVLAVRSLVPFAPWLAAVGVIGSDASTRSTQARLLIWVLIMVSAFLFTVTPGFVRRSTWR